MNDVNKKMAKGATWMVLFQLTGRVIGVVSTIILARLLIPADFGIVAMGMSIIAILELLGAFNFDLVLIQKQDAGRSHYNTAWTFQVIFASVSAAILATLAVPAANFYDESALVIVLYVLAVGNMIKGFENVGVVAFRKEMEFNKEFVFLIAKRLIGFFVTVSLAFALRNYWALVIGTVIGNIAGVLLSYIMHPFRPRFSLAARHELFNFSKWLLLNNILNFVRLRSADFVIGRLSGSQGLGLYNVAYDISNMPTTRIMAPINRAVFPGYAKMALNLRELKEGFLNVYSTMLILILPAAIGIWLTADLIVPVLLGEKWTASIPLIEILSIFGGITASQTNAGYIFLALGKPKVIALIVLLGVSVQIPLLIYLTMAFGVIGAAWAYLATATMLVPLVFVFLFKYLGLRFRELLSAVWRPIFATGFMTISVLAYRELSPVYLEESLKTIQLFVVVCMGAIVYSFSLYGLWRLSGGPETAEYHIIAKLESRFPFLKKLQAQH
jgi:lipopolysaccharide exporter